MNFPREYAAYQKTMETSKLVDYSKYGRYGGSEAFSRLDKYPNLMRMFAGYPFSVEYREEQGHLRAVEDVVATKRLGDKKPGTCMTCKSPQVPQFIEKYGAQDVLQYAAEEACGFGGLQAFDLLRRLPQQRDDGADRAPPGFHRSHGQARRGRQTRPRSRRCGLTSARSATWNITGRRAISI